MLIFITQQEVVFNGFINNGNFLLKSFVINKKSRKFAPLKII
jgi:hypothetical protein